MRSQFLDWRDALTLYAPCCAFVALALHFSLRVGVRANSPTSPTTSSTRSVETLPVGAADFGAADFGATAFHIWWLVAIFIAVGARHLFFYRREQATTRRLQSDVAQLGREVATRTRQMLSLHSVSSGLTNTLSRDQVIGAALERMVEAVRADAGVIWLRTDFDHDLSRSQDRSSQGLRHAQDSHDALEQARSRLVEGIAPTSNGALAIEYSNGAYIGAITERGAESAFPNGNAATQLPDDWRLVRSRGYEETLPKAALAIMNEALQRGGISVCVRECRQRKEVGDVSLTAICINNQIVGVLGATRWRKALEPIERRIMDAVAAEVGVALRNAQLYQEAHRRAELDGVTNLLNHRSIQEKIGVEVMRARNENRELTIVMMDLNNFKFFNDMYGHPVGDTVLRTVAHCLRETCRPTDIVGRYGGDEFIALLPSTGAQDALELCRKISERIERESFDSDDQDGRRIPISLSFGAAIYPHDGATTLDLLSAADANLYEAKRGGAPIHGLSRSTDNAELRQLKDVGVGRSFGVLDALVTAIDNKDHYTRRHSEDVTHWATLMARELGWTFEAQRAVHISGLLHDVGKIAVPDSILRKPGRLNDDEFAILQQHPVFGALIVKDVPNLPDVLGGIRHHHERFDGKGYPDKLAGEEIPLFGRLLAIPDCFSAMTTNRPYRKALTWSEAFTEIEAGSNTQFDPQMVDAFLEVMARIVSQKNASPLNAGAAETLHEVPISQRKAKATLIIPSVNSAISSDLVPADKNAYADSSIATNIKPKRRRGENAQSSTQTPLNVASEPQNIDESDSKMSGDVPIANAPIENVSPTKAPPRLRHTPRNSLFTLDVEVEEKIKTALDSRQS